MGPSGEAGAWSGEEGAMLWFMVLPWRDPPEQWLLPCTWHVGLGFAGRRSFSKAPGGASVGGKICQSPLAPSSPFAWCFPLASVADTEGFF